METKKNEKESISFIRNNEERKMKIRKEILKPVMDKIEEIINSRKRKFEIESPHKTYKEYNNMIVENISIKIFLYDSGNHDEHEDPLIFSTELNYMSSDDYFRINPKSSSTISAPSTYSPPRQFLSLEYPDKSKENIIKAIEKLLEL